jgi:hypothetical protein
MRIFRVIGACLITLGILAAVAILLFPFQVFRGAGILLRGPETSLWLFFVLCFIAGFVLFALGSKKASIKNLLEVAGSILLILGLTAATAIFLIKVNLLIASSTTSLWWLFVPCTILGGVAVYVSDEFSVRNV